VPSQGARARLFPSTRWTLIRRAQGSAEARRKALDELLCVYWKPLLRLAMLRGLAPEQAADAVQDFALRLLENQGFMERLDPSRGRLRSFLRMSFTHHLDSAYTAERAQKRGGAYRILSIDLPVLEPIAAPATDPNAAYDRQWAESVLERALLALKSEFDAGVRGGPFELVESYFRLGEAPSYQVVAERWGMSVAQVKAFLHRARVRYRDLVAAELRDTLDSEGEIEDELAYLLGALRA
jgi:RNA polymerase sigma-70 factor (ECF subfamily)